MRYGYFADSNKQVIDEITAVFMPAGKSYTGADQIEIFCHGGRKVVELILSEILKSGIRSAEPGEFTKMAFLSGRIDLAKAESVAEIIAANTQSSYNTAREHLTGAYTEHIGMLREKMIEVIADVEASIDYPDEDIDPKERDKQVEDIDKITSDIKILLDSYKGGRIINEGFKIAIAGRPNAGKSSLFNLLLKQQRALVTPTPGTTRDYLSEWVDLEGFKVNIIDTAGLRKSGGKIEKAGQESSKGIIENADLILWMVDLGSKAWQKNLIEDIDNLSNKTHKLLIGNKIDTVTNTAVDAKTVDISLSCKTEKGINQLKEAVVNAIKENMPDLTSGVTVTSLRHKQKLSESLKNLKTAGKKIRSNESPELTAFDLRNAVNAIDEITGKIYNEEILEKIFSKFCIGK